MEVGTTWVQPVPRRRKRAELGLWTGLVALFVALILLGYQHGFGLPDFAQFAIDGLQAGAIYALVALGFVVVYRVTGVINFAQGGFVMLGPMLTVAFLGQRTTAEASQLFLSALGAILLTGLVGLLTYGVALRLARTALSLTRIMLTVGVYLILQGAALLIWGPRPHVLPAFTTLSMQDRLVVVGEVVVRAQTLWIWACAATLLALLAAFFEFTLLGKAMWACAVNRTAARLVGVPVDTMEALAFTLAAFLGAAAGIVVGPVTRPTFDMGLEIGLKGFVAAVMGGLVDIRGSVVGGLVLGVVETLWAGVTRAGFRDVIAFLVLILLLLFRPPAPLSGEA